MLEGMHEFYGVVVYKQNVEKEIGRSLTDVEWREFISKLGNEIDRVDSEVVGAVINELKNSQEMGV